MSESSTTIDTPEGIFHWRLMSLVSQLSLELSTGHNFYGSKGSAYKGVHQFIDGMPPRATKKNKILALVTIFENCPLEVTRGPVCTRAKEVVKEVLAAEGWVLTV